MFKIIDACGGIHEAYGTFLDADGDIQFILCDSDGNFYKTDTMAGYYKLYPEDTKGAPCKCAPKETDKKKARKYYRKCGGCGKRFEQSLMTRTNKSPNGWFCCDCYVDFQIAEHPEDDIDEW